MRNLNEQTLKFLNGHQSAIDYMRDHGGASEGAFYLTDDTHRLYIGAKKATYSYHALSNSTDFTAARSNGYSIYTLVSNKYVLYTGNWSSGTTYYAYTPEATNEAVYPLPVNAGIEEVPDISSLPIYPANEDVDTADSPESGAPTFYYVKNGNILCVYGETSPGQHGWIQINSDTFIEEVQIQAGSRDGNSAPKVVLKVNNGNENNNSPVFSFTTDTTDDVALSSISGTTATGPYIVVNTKRAEITAGTTDTKNTKLGIVHYYKKDSNTIPTIANADSYVTLKPGDYIDSVTTSDSDITIKGKSQQITNIQITPGSANTTLAITQKSNTNTDNGPSVTLPTIKYGSGTAVGGVTDAKLTYNLGNTTGMSVYTIAEVNRLVADTKSSTLAVGNAMRYAGTLDAATYSNVSTLLAKEIKESEYYNPTKIVSGTKYWKKDATGTFVEYTATSSDATNNYSGTVIFAKAEVVVGDTYRIITTMTQAMGDDEKAKFTSAALAVFGDTDANDSTTPDFKLHKGDLIIASDTGWDIVPSGDEPSYTFKFSPSSTGAVLKLTNENEITTGTANIVGDNIITAATETANNTGTINVTHKAVYGTTLTGANDKGFTALANGTALNNTYTETAPSGFKTKFKTITAIGIDAYGHIANYTAEEIKQNYLYSVTSTNTSGGVNLTFTDAIGNKTPFQIRNTTETDSTVKLTVATNATTQNRVDIKAELKWGSF